MAARFYCRHMKRISILLVAVLLCSGAFSQAQDAAVEERLNKLSGQIEDLLAAMAKQDKRLTAFEKELETVREQAAKPTGNFASQEDLRKLAETLKDIDRKRVEDNEKILKEIEKLAKAPAVRPPRTPKGNDEPPKSGGGAGGGAEKGYEYVIATGDTLSTIAQAYREKGVKVTTDQILKANPGLKEKSLKVGQKIFIPAS